MEILATIKAIALALKEFFTWRAREAEITARVLVQTELERKDKENNELEEQITGLRNAGGSVNNERADRLLDQSAANTTYVQTLPAWIPDTRPGQVDSNSGRGVQPANAGNLGINGKI